jgi:adenosyl cobinamide kinase/adenosyl cobinamide phosphate guanylyltransferase
MSSESAKSNVEPKLILLLGGARAGKSSYALKLVQHLASPANGVCFIATAQGLDEEMSARIERHRTERPAPWITVEEPYRIDRALQSSEADIVIVDCLTLFVSNLLMQHEDLRQAEEVIKQITGNFLSLARERRRIIICVSNETGLGIVPDNALSRTFRDLLGSVNQELAAAADEVYLLIAGLPMQLKPGIGSSTRTS